MGNELMMFSEMFGELTIRTSNEKVLFKANDVLKTLGYSEGSWRTILSRKCKGVTKCNVPHPQSKDKEMLVNFITEGDVYRLIGESKLPSAERFESWVFDEVLPQIRKTGGYIPIEKEDDEKTILVKAIGIYERTVKEKDVIISQKDALIEEQSKDVAVAKMLSSTKGTKDMKEFADSLGIKGLGRNNLYGLLREMGIILYDKTIPYRKYIESRKFVVVPGVARNGMATLTTRITPKGEVWLTKKILKYLANHKKSISSEVKECAAEFMIGILKKSEEELNAMCIHPRLFIDEWDAVSEYAETSGEYGISLFIQEMITEV